MPVPLAWTIPDLIVSVLKILFTTTLTTSFIREDLRLLQKHHQVDLLKGSGILVPFRVALRILRCDVTYTWFASVYSFFVVLASRMFRRPSVIVIGGVDVAKIPEIRYGVWLTPWKVPFVRWALRHATRILAVDPSIRQEAIRLAAYPGENIEYVPTGYDASFWKPMGEKERLVLTVAGCNDPWRMKVKGIDILFEAARRSPDLRFVVVGVSAGLIGKLRGAIPENVAMEPFVDQTVLLRFYQRAAVYCQPSYTEGLPNSLCEAMLCECVPVGSRAGGIPTAIAEHGFLVPYGDPDALAEALQEAFEAPPGAGRQAREFIANTFTVERREAALLRILEELTRGAAL